MNRSEASAGLRAAAGFLLLAVALAVPAVAQVQSADTTQPIAIKPAPKVKKKSDKFSGQIIAVNKTSIKVRGEGNYSVRDFAYSPKVSQKIARGLAGGRYRSGQPVQIKYVAGSDVAIGISR
jgi:hypothetical protein